MYQIQIFKHDDFGEIRTAGTWEHPLFCLADVCRALELPQVAKVIQRLDKEVLTTHPLQTAGGMQNFYFVNEDRLYDTIFESRKPAAKKFRKWVTSEVLPSIRKTGVYILASWKKVRAEGKIVRRNLTDAIKDFTVYATSQGTSRKPLVFYSQISALVNKAVGLPNKKARDNATEQQLKVISFLEDGITHILIDVMHKKLPYKKIEEIFKAWINNLIDTAAFNPFLN